VSADDRINDMQTEAGVLAAGGEVGFEDARQDLCGNARAFVGDVDFVATGLGEGVNRDDAAGWHCLGGVEEEVHEDALPFGAWTAQVEAGIELAEDADFGTAKESGQVADKVSGAINDDSEVNGGEVLIGEAVDEAAAAFDAAGDGRGERLRLFFVAEEFSSLGDGFEDVVEVVRESGQIRTLFIGPPHEGLLGAHPRTWASVSQNSGKDTDAASAFRMETGPEARRAATAQAMAMRWSP